MMYYNDNNWPITYQYSFITLSVLSLPTKDTTECCLITVNKRLVMNSERVAGPNEWWGFFFGLIVKSLMMKTHCKRMLGTLCFRITILSNNVR